MKNTKSTLSKALGVLLHAIMGAVIGLLFGYWVKHVTADTLVVNNKLPSKFTSDMAEQNLSVKAALARFATLQDFEENFSNTPDISPKVLQEIEQKPEMTLPKLRITDDTMFQVLPNNSDWEDTGGGWLAGNQPVENLYSYTGSSENKEVLEKPELIAKASDAANFAQIKAAFAEKAMQ